MSGSQTEDDPNVSAVWWFEPGNAKTRCDVLVYRPDPERWQDSAATAAQFYVMAGRGGERLAGFVVNLSTDPGTWAAAGTFPVSQSGIAVQLMTRGVPRAAGARLPLTQIKVVCTG
jgi:hypothetical protein